MVVLNMQPLAVGQVMKQSESILDIKDLTVSRSGKVVLNKVDLAVKKGEFIGLVGPNGSGKSTLLLAILGVLKAQQGTIDIYGHIFWHHFWNIVAFYRSTNKWNSGSNIWN